MKYLRYFEDFSDFEFVGTPEDAKFKLGDNVRIVKGWDSHDYDEDSVTLLWDDTVYKLQKYYKKEKNNEDYLCEIFDSRDDGFYVVHESQLEFVPEYEVIGKKYNL